MEDTNQNDPHWMLLFTPLAFLTGCIAFKNNFYIIAIAEWFLVISSIIYWLKLTCEFRRKIDIIVVQLSLYTHIFYSIICNSSIAIICYLIGAMSYLVGLNINSNIMHSLVWIFGCVGNYNLIGDLLLFTGIQSGLQSIIMNKDIVIGSNSSIIDCVIL